MVRKMDIASDKSNNSKSIKVRTISVTLPICTTLVALGPYLWLIMGITTNEKVNLLFCAIVSLPLIVATTLIWVWFVHSRKEDKALNEELSQIADTSSNQPENS
jgi:hypothetical protein